MGIITSNYKDPVIKQPGFNGIGVFLYTPGRQLANKKWVKLLSDDDFYSTKILVLQYSGGQGLPGTPLKLNEVLHLNKIISP